jgi:hypothetical protein
MSAHPGGRAAGGGRAPEEELRQATSPPAQSHPCRAQSSPGENPGRARGAGDAGAFVQGAQEPRAAAIRLAQVARAPVGPLAGAGAKTVLDRGLSAPGAGLAAPWALDRASCPRVERSGATGDPGGADAISRTSARASARRCDRGGTDRRERRRCGARRQPARAAPGSCTVERKASGALAEGTGA